MYMGFDAVASAADVAGTTEETALAAYIADIGEMLRARRERLHLTRAELTQRAGVGLQTVIRIEAGNPGTAIVNLFKVAQSLGCDINEISGALAKAIESPLKT